MMMQLFDCDSVSLTSGHACCLKVSCCCCSSAEGKSCCPKVNRRPSSKRARWRSKNCAKNQEAASASTTDDLWTPTTLKNDKGGKRVLWPPARISLFSGENLYREGNDLQPDDRRDYSSGGGRRQLDLQQLLAATADISLSRETDSWAQRSLLIPGNGTTKNILLVKIAADENGLVSFIAA